jgi:hypothetical protein
MEFLLLTSSALRDSNPPQELPLMGSAGKRG